MYLDDMRDRVSGAFNDAFKKAYPPKKQKDAGDGAVVGGVSEYAYCQKIAEDHVIFERKGKLYRADYAGGFEKPVFGDLKKAVEVEVKHVPKKYNKKGAGAGEESKKGVYEEDEE